MHKPSNLPVAGSGQPLNRRQFLASTGVAMSFTLLRPELAAGTEANGKIALGLIGCGGRGQWIAELFRKDGHYNLVAAADYFPDRVEEVGKKFGIPAANLYRGLGGYRRLLDQKLDAVVIETPPYFHPEHAAAGVRAGKHVYLAKPIAVDVPGCQTIAESGKLASTHRQVFLVDFQTRASVEYQEVFKRIEHGDIGKILYGEACYRTGATWGGMSDILKQNPRNPELRLRAWGINRTLSGDVITEQNIHALDVATWLLNSAPAKAYGTGSKARELLGDCWDHFGVTYHFPNKRFLCFNSKQVGSGLDDILCRVFGTTGMAETNYFGRVFIASDEAYNGGTMKNLFTDGVVRNIATFQDSIVKQDFSNPTVAPSVRSNLTAILGRTAAYLGTEVTWDQMLKTNEKWEADLRGLKI